MSGYEEFRNNLAKFQAAIAIRDAQIISNPLPHLARMENRCVELIRVLDNVDRALSPGPVFNYGLKHEIRPLDISGEALIRCNAARKVLNDYFNPQPTKEGGE